MPAGRPCRVAALLVWMVAAPGLVGSGAGALELSSRALAGLRAEAAALLVQGLPGGTLPLATALLPEERLETAEGEGRFRVPVLFEVPGKDLLDVARTAPESEGGEAGTLDLEFYVYAVSPQGAVVDHLAETVAIDLARLGGALFEAGVKYAGAVELPPGRYALRCLFFERATGRFSLSVHEVDLSPGDDEPRLASPWVEDRCLSWLTARTAGAADGDELFASARPVLHPGEWVSVTTVLESGAPAASRALVRAELAPRRSPSEAGRSQPLALPPHDAGEMRLDLSFEVPELEPGIYDLALVVSEGDRRTVSAPVEAWVTSRPGGSEADEPAGCESSWGRIARRAVVEEGSGEEPAPTGLRRRVTAAYRELLEGLTSGGDLASSARRLAELEAKEAASGLDLLLPLRRVELDVAGDLVNRDRGALLPLLVLHHQAYLEHFETRQFALATHSRRLVTALAGEGAAAGDDAPVVADVLTSLAEFTQRHHMAIPSRQLLEQAIDFDEEHGAARFLLAVGFERGGRYASARGELERLVASDSKHMEARFRLAVMLERDGDLKACERHLRRIVRERPAPWLLSLAYQTLARLLWRDGRADEAVELLDEAVAALPGDQRLVLQRAYGLDRAGRLAEVAGALEALPLGAVAARPTPRLRYAESTARALAPLRERLRAGVGVRLPRLRRALDRAEGG